MADGSIKFDVKIDTESFEEDLKNLKSVTKDVMTDLDQAISSGVLAGVKDMESVADSQFAKLVELSEEEKDFLVNNSEFATKTEEERQRSIAAIRNKAYTEENKKLSDSAKQQQEVRDREIKQLKNSLEIGIISEADYYLQLRELRDKYFAVGSEDWENYTVEILKYCKETSEKIAKAEKEAAEAMAKAQKEAILNIFSSVSAEIDESFEELESKQKKMSEKLKDFGALYYESSLTMSDGNEAKFMALGNVERENQELEEYAQALSEAKDKLYNLLPVHGDGLSAEEMKKNKEYVKEFFSQIADMSVHEGLQFANLFNSRDDKELREYMSGWTKKQDLADWISQMLYSDETFDIYNQNVDNMADSMKKKLEETFGELPDNFFDKGVAAALGFGEGFEQSLEKVFEDISSHMREKMNALYPFVDGISFDGSGVVNNNTTSYNIYGANSSKSTALEIYKQNKMEQMLVGDNR